MRTHALISAALALSVATTLAANAVADEPVVAGDLAKLQGQWTAQLGPKKIPLVVTVKGSGVSLTITGADGQDHDSKGEIKIDGDAKPHKTLDWIKFITPSGETAPENLGIYKIDGDSLTICNGGPGNDRPTEFRAGEGGPPQLFVLKRKTAASATGGDRAKLQGSWTAKVGPQKNIQVSLTIKENAATLVIAGPDGQGRESKGEIKIDEEAKPHKTLDWVRFTTRSGETAPDNLAIYTLDGDTLTVCSGGIGNERPTEFRVGEGNQPSLIVLKRE